MSDFPLIAPVRQHLTEQAIADPYAYTRAALETSALPARVHAGMAVAALSIPAQAIGNRDRGGVVEHHDIGRGQQCDNRGGLNQQRGLL